MNYSNFIEYQNWGWNAITVSFIGTVIFGIIEGWGIWQQRKTIIMKNSSQSIPMMANAYFCVFFICFFIYGIQMHSIAMIINGLLAIPFIAMHTVAIKTSDSTKSEKWHISFLALIPLIVFSPYSQKLFAVMLVVASLIGTQTLIKILYEKDSGSVEPKFLWALILCISFWEVYAWHIKDTGLFIANSYSLVMLLVTIYVWNIYSPKAKIAYLEELRGIEKELLLIVDEELSQNQLDEFGQIEELAIDMGGSEIGLCFSQREYLNRRRMILVRRIGRLPYTPPISIL